MKNRKLLGKNVLKKPYLPTFNVVEDNNYLSLNKWRYVFYLNLHKSDRQKSCINIWPQGITQIYKEKCLKEAYGVISLSTKSVIFILIFNKVMDKREVNSFKDDLYGVIRFYGFRDEVINKVGSSVLIHGILLLLTCKRIPVFGGDVDMENAETYVKPYVWFIEQPYLKQKGGVNVL